MGQPWDDFFRIKRARVRLLKKCRIEGDCWIWRGPVRGEYGIISIDGRTRNAHRVSYALFVHPVAEGVSILHACRNKLCCAPDHLYEKIQERPLTPGQAADAS